MTKDHVVALLTQALVTPPSASPAITKGCLQAGCIREPGGEVTFRVRHISTPHMLCAPLDTVDLNQIADWWLGHHRAGCTAATGRQPDAI